VKQTISFVLFFEVYFFILGKATLKAENLLIIWTCFLCRWYDTNLL